MMECKLGSNCAFCWKNPVVASPQSVLGATGPYKDSFKVGGGNETADVIAKRAVCGVDAPPDIPVTRFLTLI